MKHTNTAHQSESSLSNDLAVRIDDYNQRLLVTLKSPRSQALWRSAIASLIIASIGFTLRYSASTVPIVSEPTPKTAPLQLD